MSDHRVPALDGVRGIALLIVVFAHTRPQIYPGGNIGVDLFFVLSGYLITTILVTEHMSSGAINVGRFYMRRALRLLPALFLLVACVILWTWAFDPRRLQVTLGDAMPIIFYVWNWEIALTYGNLQMQPMFQHLWSLSVEEQFYIFWPFVLIASLSKRSPYWLAPTLMVAGIVGPALARLILWEPALTLPLYYRTDLRFDSLMYGAFAAWLVVNGKINPGPVGRRHLGWAGLMALVAFLVLARFNLLSNGVVYVGGYIVICGLAASIIVAAAVGNSRALNLVLTFQPLRWTGKISYGLYLWHVPIFKVANLLPVGPLARNLIAIAATYVIAAASFYLMEVRFLRLKDRFAASAAPPPQAAVAAAE
jgi:peptidoglycan/LPS O-acetylase OafA/YrhL